MCLPEHELVRVEVLNSNCFVSVHLVDLNDEVVLRMDAESNEGARAFHSIFGDGHGDVVQGDALRVGGQGVGVVYVRPCLFPDLLEKSQVRFVPVEKVFWGGALAPGFAPRDSWRTAGLWRSRKG